MSTYERMGVFLCRGGKTASNDAGFRRLRWAAEAGVGGGRVFEITQACQAEGAAQVARLIGENGLSCFVLGACALAGVPGALSRELSLAEIDPTGALVLDVCYKPDGEAVGCMVHSGAQAALSQALAVRSRFQAAACETIVVATDVLVVGDGLAALLATRDLAAFGYGVTLCAPTKRLAPPEPLLGREAAELSSRTKSEIESLENVKVIRQAELLGLTGSAGHFLARIVDREGLEIEAEFGAVIVAQGPPRETDLASLGLEPSERVVALSELVTQLGSPEYIKQRFGDSGPSRVGIVVGLGSEAGPPALRSALEAAISLRRQFGSEVSLLTGNAKVAAPDLEALSQTARLEGVLLFKFQQDRPTFEDTGEAVELSFMDEILEREVRQEADLLAVDEVAAPGNEYRRLATALGLGLGPDGTLQPDRVAALPTFSERGGVFVVGPARGFGDVSGWIDEVEDATLAVRRLLREGRVEAETGRVTVDRRLCAFCLTCVRVCPEQAMGFVSRRPMANPLICTGCGTCASECPMDAIQLWGDEDQRYQGEITAAAGEADLDVAPESSAPDVLVFLCLNSAGRALDAARLKGHAWPEGVRFIRVPCAGKIDPQYVLDAFRAGFDGVMILSCHEDACYSLTGGSWAGYRTGHLRGLLAEAGHDPRRLVKAGVAPNMSREVFDLVGRMQEELAGLGQNPLKAGAKVRRILDRYTLGLDESFTLLNQSPASD